MTQLSQKRNKKIRLDDWLIKNGFAEDKKTAFVLVTEGKVFIEGQKAVSPAQEVLSNAVVEFHGQHKYVGRGAYKLKGALEQFKLDVSGKICIDVGSATGGFTEVLLKDGAEKVYAIDTAKGKLALKLREDPRVIVMERVDIRNLQELPDRPKLVTIDVSLLSLRSILPTIMRLMDRRGEVIALFKPQYETRDPKMLKHGIVVDANFRESLVRDFVGWAEENGWKILRKIVSPIQGNEGNTEYLFYLRRNSAVDLV